MAVSSPTYTTIDEDGDHIIREGLDYWLCPASNIKIESNIDEATIQIGYQGNDGLFKSYEDNTMISTECEVDHKGGGTVLMARVSGITSNPVIIRVTP